MSTPYKLIAPPPPPPPPQNFKIGSSRHLLQNRSLEGEARLTIMGGELFVCHSHRLLSLASESKHFLEKVFQALIEGTYIDITSIDVVRPWLSWSLRQLYSGAVVWVKKEKKKASMHHRWSMRKRTAQDLAVFSEKKNLIIWWLYNKMQWPLRL